MTSSQFSRRTQHMLRWFFAMFFFVPPLLFIAIGLFLPIDSLDRWPWMSELCSHIQTAVAHAFPWFDLYRHARSTRFPQVATAASAYALVWWLATILVVLVASLAASRVVCTRLRSTNKLRQLLLLALAAPLLGALCFFGAFGLPGDPSFAKGLTVDSRVGYVLLGTLGITFSSLCLGMWPVLLLATLESTLHRPTS